jgi:hypothetical protein
MSRTSPDEEYVWAAYSERLLAVTVLDMKVMATEQDFSSLRTRTIDYFRGGGGSSRRSNFKDTHVSMGLVRDILLEMDIMMGHLSFTRVLNDWGETSRESLVSVQSRLLTFPWKRESSITPDLVPAMLRSLRAHETNMVTEKYTPHHVGWMSTHKKDPRKTREITGPIPSHLLKIEGSFATIVSTDDDYHKKDSLTDYFTEYARMVAAQRGCLSPVARFMTDAEFRKDLVWACLKAGEEITPVNLREHIYRMTTECSSFKITSALGVLDLLDAEHWLDMSSGWGDRPLAAFASSTVKTYHGFDVNTSLKTGHDELIATARAELDPQGIKDVRVSYVPFEEASVPEGKYDLAFTSPAFFDFESYSRDPAQSSRRYATLDLWMREFLFPMLSKAYRALVDDGYLAMYMSDISKDERLCEPMYLFALGYLTGCRFCGVIGLSGSEKKGVVRPVWVFQRTDVDESEEARQARDNLDRYYARFSPNSKVRDPPKRKKTHEQDGRRDRRDQDRPQKRRRRREQIGPAPRVWSQRHEQQSSSRAPFIHPSRRAQVGGGHKQTK